MYKKITSGCEKVLTLQKPVQILKKKIRMLIPDKFQEKSPKFMNLG